MSKEDYKFKLDPEKYLSPKKRFILPQWTIVALIIVAAMVMYVVFYKYNIHLTPELNNKTHVSLPKKQDGRLTKEDKMYLNKVTIDAKVKAYKSGNAGDSILLTTDETDPWPTELTLPIDLNNDPPGLGSTCDVIGENWDDEPDCGWQYYLADQK